MLSSVLAATVRLLLFRAGPQDFPFSQTPALTRSCVAFGALAAALPQLSAAPAPAALLFGAMLVLSLFVFVRLMLRLRKLENRFQQTFNALLCAIGALWLLALPAWAAVLPAVGEAQRKLIADPAIADSPARLAELQAAMQAAIPPQAAFLLFVVCVWQFAVTGRVLGQATDSGTFGGVGLALLCLLNLFAFMVVAEPLLRAFGG